MMQASLIWESEPPRNLRREHPLELIQLHQLVYLQISTPNPPSWMKVRLPRNLLLPEILETGVHLQIWIALPSKHTTFSPKWKSSELSLESRKDCHVSASSFIKIPGNELKHWAKHISSLDFHLQDINTFKPFCRYIDLQQWPLRVPQHPIKEIYENKIF